MNHRASTFATFACLLIVCAPGCAAPGATLTGEPAGRAGTVEGEFDAPATTSEGRTADPVATARAFRALLEAGRYAEARAMMSADPCRWFAPREGPGRPWTVGPASGPWAAWDEHFRSEGEEVRWTATDSSATVVVRETNDYFRLLERGSVLNGITYYFDEGGKLTGLLIATVGDRPPGLTEEFLGWARAHRPAEIAELMPGGEIDPSGDHPVRYRALLNEWRAATGRPPIGTPYLEGGVAAPLTSAGWRTPARIRRRARRCGRPKPGRRRR